MNICKSVMAITTTLALAFFAPSANAKEDARSLSMISLLTVDPSKEEQFSEAWKTVRETAMANDYGYTDYVGGWRNHRWIVTPLKNFADVDALLASRKAVEEAGGRKIEKALADFDDALVDSHTFFSKDDMELSYWPEGYNAGNYMEIDSFHFQYGKRDEMRAILAEYKALAESKGIPYGYQVSWDWIGSTGNSVTIVSYADDAVAMAQMNAAIDSMMENDETYKKLIDRFLTISTDSQTMRGTYNPDASINLPEGQ